MKDIAICIIAFLFSTISMYKGEKSSKIEPSRDAYEFRGRMAVGLLALLFFAVTELIIRLLLALW